jgi:hypothetical protein
MRSDAQALRCQIDLAQEPQQAKKETQHRCNEQQGHRNRCIEAREGAQKKEWEPTVSDLPKSTNF